MKKTTLKKAKMNKSGISRKATLSVFPSVQDIEQRLQDHMPIARRYRIQLIRECTEKIKKRMVLTENKSYTRDQLTVMITEKVRARADALLSGRMKRVVNGTGVILHTGLGRAPLSDSVFRNLNDVLANYCNLEIDLGTGGRGDRNTLVEPLICLLTGAESACVVNNNAAAVLIILNSLATGKEVIVSRGQLIEIGGSFRLPEVMEKSGVFMREVGTTNKTHPNDYLRAINKNSALVLAAHTSNYRVLGFTRETGLKEISAICRKKRIPLVYDLGGGVMDGLEEHGLPHEPVIRDALNDGADLISFSGDKLLGGCQCGIILGRKKWINRIKSNPLMRALRCGKMTFAALETTLKLYLQEKDVNRHIPAHRMLTESIDTLRKRATDLQSLLSVFPDLRIRIVEESSQAGSGTLPLEKLPGFALTLEWNGKSASALAAQLRLANVPVIGYIKNNKLHMNMRAIRDDELSYIKDAIMRLHATHF